MDCKCCFSKLASLTVLQSYFVLLLTVILMLKWLGGNVVWVKAVILWCISDFLMTLSSKVNKDL